MPEGGKIPPSPSRIMDPVKPVEPDKKPEKPGKAEKDA